MSTLTVKDPYGNTFEIDASARPYWDNPNRAREGYTVLPGEPATASEPRPDESGTPKSSKRAARAAQDVKEQPDG